MTDDPWPKFQESGEHKETFNEVISRDEVIEYLQHERPSVLASVRQLRCNKKFNTLQINYACAGGYQRSVVIARYIFRVLDHLSLWQEGLEIELNHLTLPLVMEQKRQLDLSLAK
jgi:RNase adaptor protein for sRNA GlmZ degradation